MLHLYKWLKIPSFSVNLANISSLHWITSTLSVAKDEVGQLLHSDNTVAAPVTADASFSQLEDGDNQWPRIENPSRPHERTPPILPLAHTQSHKEGAHNKYKSSSKFGINLLITSSKVHMAVELLFICHFVSAPSFCSRSLDNKLPCHDIRPLSPKTIRPKACS